jgi:hypothetical protein
VPCLGVQAQHGAAAGPTGARARRVRVALPGKTSRGWGSGEVEKEREGEAARWDRL